MPDTYTVKDITHDLRFLLTLTNLFDADDEGFWRLADTEERYKHKLDGSDDGQEIILFQDPLPRGNFLFFNPFSEGYGKPNPASTFYYKTVRVATNQTMMIVLFHVARAILASKQASVANEEFTITPAVVRMSSVPIAKRQTIYDVIDDDMIEEFKKLFSRINDTLIHVPYRTQQMTATVTCDPLTDPDWDSKYGKDVRKKSIAAFKALIMGVLGINKPEDLQTFSVKYDPEIKSAPRFHATMSVYLKLYSKFNDIVADAYAVEGKASDQFVVDLGQFAETIERFPLAYAIAKHMIQPTMSSVKATDTQTSDTSSLKFANQGQSGNQQRRFAGPPVVDEFGRTVRQTAPSLSLGTPPVTSSNRFKPHVLNDAPTDPFAPATRQTNTGGFTGGFGTPAGGLSQGLSFGNSGGGLNLGGGFGSPSGGFNSAAPSNFGMPGTKRWFG